MLLCEAAHRKVPARTHKHTNARVWSVLCVLLDTFDKKKFLEESWCFTFQDWCLFPDKLCVNPKRFSVSAQHGLASNSSLLLLSYRSCRADFALGAPRLPGV